MSAPARTLDLERGPASADTWEAMLAMRVFEMRVVRVMVLLVQFVTAGFFVLRTRCECGASWLVVGAVRHPTHPTGIFCRLSCHVMPDSRILDLRHPCY